MSCFRRFSAIAFYKKDSTWLNLASEKCPGWKQSCRRGPAGARCGGELAGLLCLRFRRQQTAVGHGAVTATCPGKACSPGRVGGPGARPASARRGLVAVQVSLPPSAFTQPPRSSPVRPSPSPLSRTLEKMSHEAKKRKPFSDFSVFFLNFTVSFKFLLHLTLLQVCRNYFPKEAALLLANVSPRLL